MNLNPKVDSPPFAATVTAAAPLQHYQVDLHQPWDLTEKLIIISTVGPGQGPGLVTQSWLKQYFTDFMQK